MAREKQIKRNLKSLSIGDTVQIRFNGHIVNGFYTGKRGVMLGRKYITGYAKKLYLTHTILKKIRFLKDYKFSPINPRVVLVEKKVFEPEDSSEQFGKK